MSLAAIFVGWECGFQVCIIGMNALAFFAEYIGRSVRGKYVPATPLCFLGMAFYLQSYYYSHNYKILYPLSEDTKVFFQYLWGIVVFVITIVCLWGFTLLSFHSERLLSIQATYDKLTGLPNRYFVARHEEENLTDNRWIAMTDIDDFKKINDRYGHNYGDYVLQTLAKLMKERMRDCIVCRWGGEEFLILGENDNMDRVYEMLDLFRKEVEGFCFSYEDIDINLTLTIGFSKYKVGLGMVDWVSVADKKLYVGKYSGKNKVVA
ncbi:MAG: GGDEF domain-containing protein [Lachnospiraceae bacterium]|nr:GGDEF domain-containing protein [Lachnospiraceae bacterium]